MVEHHDVAANAAFSQWRGSITASVEILADEVRAIREALSAVQQRCAGCINNTADIAKLFSMVTACDRLVAGMEQSLKEHHSIGGHAKAMDEIAYLKSQLSGFEHVVSEHPSCRGRIQSISEAVARLEEVNKSADDDHDQVTRLLACLDGEHGLFNRVARISTTVSNMKLKIAAWTGVIAFLAAALPVGVDILGNLFKWW